MILKEMLEGLCLEMGSVVELHCQDSFQDACVDTDEGLYQDPRLSLGGRTAICDQGQYQVGCLALE